MAEYVDALEAALQSVERPGTFATGGKTTPFLPDLQVRKLCMLITTESVVSVCKDGTSMPYVQYKRKLC